MSDDEDDYMTMIVPDKGNSAESSLQRRQRERREGEAKGRPLSKADLAAKEAAEREEALSTSLDQSNRGFKMMQKLGFKGGGLGKAGNEGRSEPIGVDVREGRGGVGLDAERKRKIRAEIGETKRRKVEEEGDYRDRVKKDAESKRVEGQVFAAMKVAERLDDDVLEEGEGKQKRPPPLRGVNVLWRRLARDRVEKERDQRMRVDLQNSLSRLPTYEDPDEDEQYKQAFGIEEVDLEEENPDLDAFERLEPEDRLEKLILHLREVHHYCFWCKSKYDTADMEGCPGTTEEDHD